MLFSRKILVVTGGITGCVTCKKSAEDRTGELP